LKSRSIGAALIFLSSSIERTRSRDCATNNSRSPEYRDIHRNLQTEWRTKGSYILNRSGAISQPAKLEDHTMKYAALVLAGILSFATLSTASADDRFGGQQNVYEGLSINVNGR
jgi:hypothetical protein